MVRTARHGIPRRHQGLPLWRQDHLAKLLLMLQTLMRRADFAERIDLVDHRLQLFFENELQHLMQFAERSHERAQQRPLLAEKEAQVELYIPARGVAAGHQTPGWRE